MPSLEDTCNTLLPPTQLQLCDRLRLPSGDDSNCILFGSALIFAALSYVWFTFTKSGDDFIASHSFDCSSFMDPAPQPTHEESFFQRMKRRAGRFFSRFNVSSWLSWWKVKLLDLWTHFEQLPAPQNQRSLAASGWVRSSHDAWMHEQQMRSDRFSNYNRNTFTRHFGPFYG